jgi:hypothetical protein
MLPPPNVPPPVVPLSGNVSCPNAHGEICSDNAHEKIAASVIVKLEPIPFGFFVSGKPFFASP